MQILLLGRRKKNLLPSASKIPNHMSTYFDKMNPIYCFRTNSTNHLPINRTMPTNQIHSHISPNCEEWKHTHQVNSQLLLSNLLNPPIAKTFLKFRQKTAKPFKIQEKQITTKHQGLHCKAWAAPFRRLQVLSPVGMLFAHTSFNSKKTNSTFFFKFTIHSLKHFVKQILRTWKLVGQETVTRFWVFDKLRKSKKGFAIEKWKKLFLVLGGREREREEIREFCYCGSLVLAGFLSCEIQISRQK